MRIAGPSLLAKERLATATIAFSDRFDLLFPIAGSLITVWAVAAGTMWAVRPVTS